MQDFREKSQIFFRGDFSSEFTFRIFVFGKFELDRFSWILLVMSSTFGRALKIFDEDYKFDP
jgi:hypothetical protein